MSIVNQANLALRDIINNGDIQDKVMAILKAIEEGNIPGIQTSRRWALEKKYQHAIDMIKSNEESFQRHSTEAARGYGIKDRYEGSDFDTCFLNNPFYRDGWQEMDKLINCRP
jgi:hypothetical protein